MISINTSIICLSLTYLNNNYLCVSKVSKWIFDKLEETQYKDDKLLQALNNENIIQFVKDKNIVEKEHHIIFTVLAEDKKYFSDIIDIHK